NTLFDEFVEEIKRIMEKESIEVVIFIKKESGYILDEKEYIEGSNKKFAGEKLENVKFKYINKEILDEFILSGEEIKHFDNFLLIRLDSSYGYPGVVYFETDDMIIDTEVMNVYFVGVILNLKTIIANMTKEKEQKKLMMAVGELIEKRDNNVSNHVMRVSMATVILAKKFKYTGDKLDSIEIAASIHDIGKVIIPDRILNKPGKLTVEEFEIIKTHTTDDFSIFDGFNFGLFKIIHNVVRHHHENWDGTGYPDGLKGKDIPLEARIVSVIDVFDALMHRRSYKDAWLIDESLSFIENNRGLKFDSEVVDKFMEVKEEIIELFKDYPDTEK
ncbi:MAG: HD domain-containing protein, partial [Clostridiales bacterium]|nr:HD domain-containing protein [Clostridiales bacterium]